MAKICNETQQRPASIQNGWMMSYKFNSDSISQPLCTKEWTLQIHDLHKMGWTHIKLTVNFSFFILFSLFLIESEWAVKMTKAL